MTSRERNQPRTFKRVGISAVAGLSAFAGLAVSAQGVRKPIPLPGTDPGGVTVALIGPGVDYTREGLVDRLARDGEGEIIGFDLVDRDRRPFCRVECEAHTEAAMALLKAAPGTRLALFKVDGPSLAAPALQMAVTAKAAVVLLELPDDPQTAALLRAASERFRDTLIVFSPRAKNNGDATSNAQAASPTEPGSEPRLQPGVQPDNKPTAETGDKAKATPPVATTGPPPVASPATQQEPQPPQTAQMPVSPSSGTVDSGGPSGQPLPSPPLPAGSPVPAGSAVATAPPPPAGPDTVIEARDGNVSPAETALAAAVRLAAEAANIVTLSPSTRGAALKARLDLKARIEGAP